MKIHLGETIQDQSCTIEYFLHPEGGERGMVIVFPGGAYQGCCDQHEGTAIAKYFNEKGVTAVIVRYRVSRPKNVAKHVTAWQDAQRAVRTVRSRAAELGIDPEKIGCTGFSAGGHLTLMTSTTSQTPAYEPVDELDQTPANLNFAIPIYPAYVLTDGATDPNANKGEGAEILSDFHFDAKTPPTCLVHGDADIYSPLGSVEVYKKLRKLGIPCELHVYAGAPHGFMFWNDKPNAADWQERCAAWLKKIGF